MSAALHSLMRAAPEEERDTGALGALLRFIAIGAAGALAFVVLSTMISLHSGMAEWVVNTLCYAALIGPVYLLHRRFSFQSDAAHHKALPRYVAVQGMALLLAALFSFVVHGVLTLPTLAASLLVISLTSGINFLVLRGWAFARSRGSERALA
jgi:putative flippase GtrA